jgi:dynein heavy chain
MVPAKNNVEIWLGHLQKEMYETVRKIISVGYHEWMDGKFKSRTDWIMAQSSQVVAVASQIIWTYNTE